MRTYLKTLARMFQKHITRLLSIILMVLVSVGFASGIGSAADKIGYSLSDYYKSVNASDFIIKSTESDGFSPDDIQIIEDVLGTKDVTSGTSFETYIEYGGEQRLMRLYFMDEGYPTEYTINKPNIISDNLPQGEKSNTYAYFESSDHKIMQMHVGDKVTLNFKDILIQLAEQANIEPNPMLNLLPESMAKVEVELCGEIVSPLTFAQDGEPSLSYNKDIFESGNIPSTTDEINKLVSLECILYMPKSAIPSILSSAIGTTDLYVAAHNRELFNDFSPAYKEYVDGQKKLIEEQFGDSVRVMTLYENYSFNALHAYGEKVELIGYVLMVAFMFVTALVVLSTMTRLLEEERAQVACLTTLGYSPFKIIFKYLLFATIATGIGGVGAYFIGLGLSSLIYWVFNYSFKMPPMSTNIAIAFFLITFAIVVVATLVATLVAGRKLTGEKPANLLRPKPPRAGKKVIVEKIPFIWNRLSFKYKSTTRNVLRYKSRFIMTVVAVAISTALIMAGLTLLDICLFRGANSTSILIISLVIVLFAGLLTAVVIYTLTNINISERNRELATLMVLGYHGGEVAGYIYREIFIDTVIGIIFGYPLSALIMYFLFSIMGAGTYATFMWAVTPFVVLLFTAIVTLILRRKIIKIDMNESLKAIE